MTTPAAFGFVPSTAGYYVAHVDDRPHAGDDVPRASGPYHTLPQARSQAAESGWIVYGAVRHETGHLRVVECTERVRVSPVDIARMLRRAQRAARKAAK